MSKNVHYLLAKYRRVKIDLGTVHLTPAVAELIEMENLNPYLWLARLVVGDWGEVSIDEERANAEALKAGAAVRAHYRIEGSARTRAVVIDVEPGHGTTIRLLEE